MIRYYAKVRRVGGEADPLDPGSWSIDYQISRSAAYEKREKAAERIRESLASRFGGEWEVTQIRSSHIGSGRR